MEATQVRTAGDRAGFEIIDEPQESASAPPAQALQEGSRLKDYEILSVLHKDDVGIFYLAKSAKGEKVGLSEYLPRELANRDANSNRVSAQAEKRVEFKSGRSRFLKEARLLQATRSAALIEVVDAFDTNGTAYAVIPYSFAAPSFYEAQPLAQAISDVGRNLSEEEALRFVLPLLDGVQAIHSGDQVHGNISPDTVLFHEGEPLLVPFSARKEQAFAPLEQCVTGSTMKQGPWTDIYSLAALMHLAVTGRTPISATQRLAGMRDTPLAAAEQGALSEGFLAAMERGLELRPEARPQSAQEFRKLLKGDLTREQGKQMAVVASAPVKAAAAAATVAAAPAKSSSSNRLLTVLAILVLAVGVLLAIAYRQRDEGDVHQAAAIVPASRAGTGKLAEQAERTGEAPSVGGGGGATATQQLASANTQASAPDQAPAAASTGASKPSAKRRKSHKQGEEETVSEPEHVETILVVRPKRHHDRVLVPLIGYPIK